MREHFRQHGAIHALWTIGVLVLVVAGLLLRAPNGQLIGEYIGFAASLASLVLALVAIGYSFVSNQSFAETIGSLRTTATDVETAAKNIANTSATLTSQSDRMLGEFAALPPAVKAIAEKIDEKFNDIALLNRVDREPSLFPDKLSSYESLPMGGQLALYVLARSFLDRKGFAPFEMLEGDVVWSSFVSGFVQAVRHYRTAGIDVRIEFLPDKDFEFICYGPGNLDFPEIIRSFSARTDGHIVSLKNKTDAYFAGRSASLRESAQEDASRE